MRSSHWFLACCAALLVVPGIAVSAGGVASADYYDHADILPAKPSFQYWLDTVATDDAAFAQIVRVARGLDQDAVIDAKELEAERIRRLETSFDFDAFIDARTPGLSDQEHLREKKDLVRYFLSDVARQKYAARNIHNVRAPEAPNFEQGSTYVLVDVGDLVTGITATHKFTMKLYAKGLCWRWFESKRLDASDTTASSGTGGNVTQTRIKQLDGDIVALDTQIEDIDTRLRAMEAELRILHAQRERKAAERIELQRMNDPYATPRMAFLTAQKALQEGNWDAFLASHSERAQKLAASGDAAQRRFLDASAADGDGKHKVYNIEILRETEYPDNQDLVLLSVKVTVVYRDKYAVSEGDNGQPLKREVEPDREERKISIRMVRERGSWRLDEDI